MTLTNVSLKVEIAFTAAPYATAPTWTDVTAYVRSVATKRGRSDETQKIEAGTATILLDNADGRFTPKRITSPSPYAGNIEPRRQVRVRALVSATPHPLWTGFTERWSLTHPGGGDYSEAQLECVDGLKLLGDRKLLNFAGEVIKSYDPQAYWPLGEPKGSIWFGDKSPHHRPSGLLYHRSVNDKSDAGSDSLVFNAGASSVVFDPDNASAGAVIDVTGARDAVRFRPAGWSMVARFKLASDYFNTDPPAPPGSTDPGGGTTPGGGGGDGTAPGGGGGGGEGTPPYDPTPVDPGGGGGITPEPTPPADPTDPGSLDPYVPGDPGTTAPTVPGAPGDVAVTPAGVVTWTAPVDDGGCDGGIDTYRLYDEHGKQIYQGADETFTMTLVAGACNKVRVQAHDCRGWGALSAWSQCAKNQGALPPEAYDRFNRADTTNVLGLADNGNTWGNTMVGGLRVASNKCAQPVAGEGGQLLDIDGPDQDFTFQVGGSTGLIRVMFRAIDENTHYRLDFVPMAYNTGTLYRVVGGTAVALDKNLTRGPTFADGDDARASWHVQIVGSRIVIANGSVVVLNRSEPALVAGTKAGFYITGNGTVDNFAPAPLKVPRAVRAYSNGGGSLAVLCDSVIGGTATDYRVTAGATVVESGAVDGAPPSFNVTGLSNNTHPALTMQAKCDGAWGSATETLATYVGIASAPTITSITALSGSRVQVGYTLGAWNYETTWQDTESGASLTLVADNFSSTSNLLTSTIGHPWPTPVTFDFSGYGLSGTSHRFRLSVRSDTSHHTDHDIVSNLYSECSEWSDPITVT